VSKYELQVDREKDPRKKIGFRRELDPMASMTVAEALVCFDVMALALNNFSLEFSNSKNDVARSIFNRHDLDELRIELARTTLKRALRDRGIQVPG
jgi:hypothetical protein